MSDDEMVNAIVAVIQRDYQANNITDSEADAMQQWVESHQDCDA